MESLRMALVVGMVGAAAVVVPAASARAQGTAARLDRDTLEVKNYRLSLPVLRRSSAPSTRRRPPPG